MLDLLLILILIVIIYTLIYSIRQIMIYLKEISFDVKELKNIERSKQK